MQPTHRDVADRCPGVFSTHAAADGAVARVRLPGGRIEPGQLEILAQAAAAHGDGFLEPTARGNLQVRGISDVAAVAQAVIDAGLAPSKTHDTVRNIEVSPLTGRIGGAADVWPVADALDAGLRADDRSTELSGRFLFGVDDGRGDIVRRHPDACAVARPQTPDAAGATAIVADIMVGGELLGSVTGVNGIVGALLDVAHDFTECAPQAWRVGDLTVEQRDSLISAARARLAPVIDGPTSTDATDTAEPIVGWFDQDDGAVLLGAVVELGRLPARLAEFLAAVGKPLIFTPDREILLCDLDEGVAETVVRVLAPMGLIFDASSPWARVSCCVGAPGCSKAAAPVRDDLLARVRAGESVEDREHWVGCGRRCGAPAGPHLLVEATPDDGYRTHRR
ncbi:precorrin-3B synthase [Gordonia sp. LSe1-13]|uniref:Precorrin-3B synthase n=1 Tax=Gordonia sesuvii TaxID=3116777 RepID=A0ABU7MCB8_9ACTN|nr:precorrin-3B synthase [Gordonia sp. LSe1-13]